MNFQHESKMSLRNLQVHSRLTDGPTKDPQECSQGSVPGEAPKGSPGLAPLGFEPSEDCKKPRVLPWALCPGMGLK